MKRITALLLSMVLLASLVGAGWAQEEPAGAGETNAPQEIGTLEETPAAQGEPGTQEPVTQEPATEEPTTEEPITEEPTTEEPGPSETPEPAACVFAFTFGAEDPVEITEAETLLTLAVGERFQLPYSVTPGDALILWSSEDEGIASVDEGGEILGVSVGEVRITATLPEGGSAELRVVVVESAGDTAEGTPGPEPTPEDTQTPPPSGEPAGDTAPPDKEKRLGATQDPAPGENLEEWVQEELDTLAAAELPPPYDLSWGPNLEARFTLPAGVVNYSVCVFLNGKEIANRAFKDDGDTSVPRTFSIPLAERFKESGTYHFGVRSEVKYSFLYTEGDSIHVYSKALNYTKPAAQLGEATSLRWDGLDADGFLWCSFVMPSNAADDGYMIRLYHYDAKTNDWALVNVRNTRYDGCGAERVFSYVPLSFFSSYMLYRPGDQYAFTVQPLSSRLGVMQNGTESPRSPSFVLPDKKAPPATGTKGQRDFLSRLYNLALGRAPDDRWDTWMNGLTSGSETGASACRGFFLGPEFEAKQVSNAAFVELLYNVCMDRPSDPGGFALWLGYLNQGISRAAVLNEFVKSPEYGMICQSYGITRGTLSLEPADRDIFVTLFVHRLYTVIMNRQPEREGVNHWTRILLEGGTGRDAAGSFAFSDEFLMAGLSDTEYVTRMYRAMLDREPEPAGMQAWLKEIALNGREGILDGFAGSPEFALLMAMYHIR